MADYKYSTTANADSGKQPGDPVGFNSKMGWGNVFERSFATPLDRTSLFISYSDAEKYAQGGSDTRGLSGTSYPGQIITVLEDGESSVYVINEGTAYTQAQADADAANEENPVEGYVNKIPEGKSVGDEDISTRTLVKLSKSDTTGAEIYWLKEDGSSY